LMFTGCSYGFHGHNSPHNNLIFTTAKKSTGTVTQIHLPTIWRLHKTRLMIVYSDRHQSLVV